MQKFKIITEMIPQQAIEHTLRLAGWFDSRFKSLVAALWG